MALYFFHSQTSNRITDTEGMQLPDDRAARLEAIKACAEMVRDSPDDFWGSRPWFITVTSGDGRILYEVSMNGIAAPPART